MICSVPGCRDFGTVVLQIERWTWACVWFILKSSLQNSSPLPLSTWRGSGLTTTVCVELYALVLFVEKAGEVHTMVKVMLNVPFRNNSSMWTDIAPEENRATCSVSCHENAVYGGEKKSKLYTWSDGSLTTSERWTTFCLGNTSATGTMLTHKYCSLVFFLNVKMHSYCGLKEEA